MLTRAWINGWLSVNKIKICKKKVCVSWVYTGNSVRSLTIKSLFFSSWANSLSLSLHLNLSLIVPHSLSLSISELSSINQVLIDILINWIMSMSLDVFCFFPPEPWSVMREVILLPVFQVMGNVCLYSICWLISTFTVRFDSRVLFLNRITLRSAGGICENW